jgi:hypothetical protein
MPFIKTGPGMYRSPSGRAMTTGQVRGYYANRGNYPGGPGMGTQFGPSAIMSPTAPGKAKNPTLSPSGKTNAATSQTPTSVLNGGKQSFGPLEYATSGREDEQRALFERARNLRVPKRRK